MSPIDPPDTSDPGAAQFLHSLAPHQVQHLRFSVPLKNAADRFSQFLEGPRTPPVPKRFIFYPTEITSKQESKPNSKPTPKLNTKLTPTLKSGRSTATLVNSGRSTTTPTKGVRFAATPATEISETTLWNEIPRIWTIDWNFYLTILCVCLVNLMTAVDATILPVTLSTISNTLNGTALQAFWLGTSFLIPAALLQPLYTMISEIMGRKPLLLFAVVLFAGGSIICAITESMVGMLLGRSIQGVGGAGIYALTNGIVSDLTSMQERSRLSSIIGILWAVGGVAGPVIGGVLVQTGNWRWMFWINVPLCGLATLSMLIFPHFKSDESEKLNKIKKVDWIGCFLLIGSTTSLLVAITWGGIVKPWSAWQTTLPLEFAIGGFIIFLLWSKFSPFECYVPVGRCMSPTSLCAFFGTAVHGMVLWGGLYMLPMYFQAAKNLTPLMAGVSLLPFSCAVGLFAIATAILTSRSSYYRPAIWLGWTLTPLGLALLVLLTRSSSTTTWAGLSIVSGTGLGILAPALLLAAQAPATNERVSSAIALHSVFHCSGRAFGVAIGGAVFQNTLLLNLRQHPDVARSALTFARDAVAFLESLHTMPGDRGSLKFVLINAYVDSLRRTWIVMAALAGAAALLCVLGIRAALVRASDSATFSHEMKTFDEEP